MKNNRFKKFVAVLLAVVTISLPSAGVSAARIKVDMKDGEFVSQLYDAVLGFVEQNYKFGVTKEELLDAAVKEFLKNHPEYYDEFGKAAFTALDPNSKFYNAEEYNSTYTDVSGIYVGIGIYVHQDKDFTILGEPIECSPAEAAGLRVGDILTSVDGESVEGFALDKVTSLIKGEEGTTVKLEVKRNGAYYTYEIKRAKIKINPVTYNMVEGTDDIGYIKISSFNANTSDAFAEAAEYFGKKGVKKIVLDLRNNLGGYLTAAINVASYFVPDESLLVTAEYKEKDDSQEYYSKKTDYKFKAAVLINGYSASASEVVSSVLRDYKTGILVGRRSYGKGTVQNVMPVVGKSYLWLTIAEYYTPSHTEIHGVGLSPDYNVVNTEKYFDINTVTKYDILRKLKVGDTGKDVYAVKERLKALGYGIVVDETYDRSTADIVKRFQEDTKLYPYGVADITTQVKINDTLANMTVEVDNQLEKAIEVIKSKK